ncbi:GPI mannosyltransferase 2-like [Amphibalanus amphitrite]|uniref:GPI mannosyltransferase 2-like n=1 Tax=Amphibalanus amphitrite TaxID=1232801 RepID=UPI001C904C95|nr:GPI mannosyltransferase 2-like [Amphibalanus amphitrite]XP_043245175.1 GPI mannosyltransferase 2-like [Amphibalanus amphitrite]
MDLTLFKQSLQIRASFILLQCMVNHLLPDHISDAFVAPQPADGDPTPSPAPLDSLATALLGGLHRWDAQYFLHIAEHGYTHEATLAFFPGLPLMTAAGAVPLEATGLLSRPVALLLSAVALNALLSALAAQALLALSARLLADRRRARTAALLFCWSPATVFLAAPYSESLFACLGFTGMLFCETDRLWGAAAAFGFAAVTRSNGTLLIGFLVYNLLHKQVAMMMPKKTKENVLRPSLVWITLCGTGRLLQAAVLSLLALTAFVVYQLFAFVLFCTPGDVPTAPHVERYLRETEAVRPGAMTSPWCNYTLPLSYGYIQDHYWDVGFLRYYRLRQLPNFLLAAPTVILILHGTATYLRRWTLTVLRRPLDGAAVNMRLLPFVLHAAALTCFMVTCAHVQVTTRVLASSSPVLYWFAADLLHGPETKDGRTGDENSRPEGNTARSEDSVLASRRRLSEPSGDGGGSPATFTSGGQSSLRWLAQPRTRAGTYVQLYFLGYAVLGTCLFSNGLPWT